MTAAAQTNRSLRAVLSVPNFRRLWTGQSISQVGDGLASLTSMIVVNQLTGSTAALAGMTIAIALPQLIFGLMAGVLVDRWDRKRIMIVSDVLRGLLVLGLILIRRPEQIWIFYVLGFAQATVGTFFDPARSALLPQLLGREDLLAANALSQTTRVVTLVIGESLAGFLVGLTGSSWPAFSLDALSFFVSAVFIAGLVIPASAGPRQAGGGASGTLTMLGEGLRYMADQRLLVGLAVTLVFTMLGIGALNVLFVPFLTNEIHLATTWMGVVGSAQVAGMAVGAGLVGGLAARFKEERLVWLGTLGMGVCFIGVGLVQGVAGFLAVMLAVGLFMAPAQAAIATLIQQTVPDEKRGRVSAAISTLISLSSVISMGFAGGLGSVLPIRTIFFFSGAVIFTAGLVGAVLIRRPA